MDIVIKTLGCKANRYESDRIIDYYEDRFNFFDAQYEDPKNADIIIVNTCTVTHIADRKSRQAVTVLKTAYPGAKVIIYGCGANTDKNSYKMLENVDFVAQNFNELCGFIENIAGFNTSEVTDAHGVDCVFPLSRKRALIKIQDGCNNFCTYCIIPYARGREKSRSLKEIISEIKNKVSKGYKEVVITGINIGEWKEDGRDLADLIEQILSHTSIERLRLSSIEPQNFSPKFLALYRSKRFCRHLHISLQSGSDTILKGMNRHYDSKFFRQMVEDLRKAAPEISITTDIIVGFPGETEELFNETLSFVREVGFSKIHIFPYSKRKSTVAAGLPDQVPYSIKKERCKILADIEKEMRMNYYKTNIGREDSVLVETVDENGFGTGFTSNYLKTRVKGGIKNKIIKVKLEELQKNGQINATIS